MYLIRILSKFVNKMLILFIKYTEGNMMRIEIMTLTAVFILTTKMTTTEMVILVMMSGSEDVERKRREGGEKAKNAE